MVSSFSVSEGSGCDLRLEVLPNCMGRGSYSHEPYTANDTKIMRNSQELFASLPLRAANLKGELQKGRALRTDFMLAGMYTLPPGSAYPRTMLSGKDCDRATHVVARIYVGGFAMASGETQSMEAAATVFGVGAGGSSEESMQRITNEGIADACNQTQKTGEPSQQCDVPLRVGLFELAAKAEVVADQSSAELAVKSWLAFAQNADGAGMAKLLTEEGRTSEERSGKSFTASILEEGIRVAKFRVTGVEEGDTATTVRAKAQLLYPSGEEDNEPMTFKVVAKDGKWWINDIR